MPGDDVFHSEIFQDFKPQNDQASSVDGYVTHSLNASGMFCGLASSSLEFQDYPQSCNQLHRFVLENHHAKPPTTNRFLLLHHHFSDGSN